MVRLSWYLALCLGLIALSILTTACHGNGSPVQTPATSIPTFTPLPSRTPRPSQTPYPTATPSPTATPTHTPEPTIQLPKLALTPLPFTPEPISALNAGRISELTRWEITNPAFWQKPDGSTLPWVEKISYVYSFQLAFSTETSILLFPVADQGSGYGVALFNKFIPIGDNKWITCGIICSSANFADKCVFPGIPHLSIPDGKQIILISPNKQISPDDYIGYYLSPNGETLVTQSHSDCQIQFTNLHAMISTEKIVPLNGGKYVYSADGKVFWLGPDKDGCIAILNPQNGKLLQKTRVEWKNLAELTKAEAEWIISNLTGKQQQDFKDYLVNLQLMDILALSPDIKTFISSIHMDPGRVKFFWSDSLNSFHRVSPKGILRIVLWRMSDGAMQHILVEKDEWNGEPSVAYSPDSKQAAIYISGDHKIGLFDIATGKLMDEFGDGGYQSLAYSPDGQILIAGTDQRLELWDIATGNLLAEIAIPAKLDDWAISPDGRYIGTVSEDGRISLWGVQP